MTMTPITTTSAETVMNPSARAVPPNPAVRFLEALGDLDFDRLEECLAADIWFRALLPHGEHTSRTARETAATYRTWFEGTGQSTVLESDHHTMAGREFVRYRFVLKPEWAPEQWHTVEQVGFGRAKEGRLSRLDIVCTGMYPSDATGAPV